MPGIRFEDVSKVFPGQSSGLPAVRDIDLDIDDGRLVVLLGPSGCGKTTLLRMVNRLIEPTSGHIYIGDTEIHRLSVTRLRRQIGYVIQQTGLFPHMSVAGNIATVPKLLGWPRDRIRERIDELLDLVDLPPDEYRDRYPRQLSGGQQQRVGIARAMAADPGIMLMDEPFGAIDAITRADLQNELLRIHARMRKTVVFVTHDVEEALKLADQIAVMRSGRIVQYGSPYDLLTHPADEFVAALLDTDDIFRQLSLISVTQLMAPPNGNPSGITVGDDQDVRTALSRLLGSGAQELQVVDEAGKPVGQLTLRAILSRASEAENKA